MINFLHRSFQNFRKCYVIFIAVDFICLHGPFNQSRVLTNENMQQLNRSINWMNEGIFQCSIFLLHCLDDEYFLRVTRF